MSEKIKYVIEHNGVREVEKIGSEGIISRGYDSVGNSVVIQNKDAGKSVELMNIAMLDEEEGGRNIKLYLIIGSIFFFVIFLILGLFIFSSSQKNTQVPQKNIAVYNPSTKNTKNTVEKIDNSRDQEIENARLSYNYETLKDSFAEIKSKYEKKVVDFSKIEKENQKLKQKNEELKKNIDDLKNTPKKIDSNAFILYLGNRVSELCKQAELKGEKNSCKDLFYNFVNND